MTSVYGVTMYGARAQIENQLRHNIDNFPPELVFDARAYLAEKTFECLYIMFTTNKAIQVCGAFAVRVLLFLHFFGRGKTRGGSKIAIGNTDWLAVHPTLAGRHQQNHHTWNRFKALHQNRNLLEQKRRCSNISGRLHQSPAAQLA